MKTKKIIGWILRLPLILLLLGSFIVSIYLYITKQYDISIGAVIILGLIIISNVTGTYLINSSKKETNENQISQSA